MFSPVQFLLETTQQAGGLGGTLGQLLPLLLVIPIFYFILIRPQRKKDKEAQTLKDELQVGDEIVTVGGIVGRIVSCKKDQETILVESGNDRTKLRMLKNAIQVNNSASERAAEAKAAAKAAAKEEKERKALGKSKVDETTPTKVDETK